MSSAKSKEGEGPSATQFHRFWQQSVSKEQRAGLFSRRSSSTPSISPPWGLHNVPEDTPALLPACAPIKQIEAPACASPLRLNTGTTTGRSSRSISSRGSCSRNLRCGRRSVSSSSLQRSGQLVFFNERKRQRTPSVRSEASTSLTSVSQISLRREVESAVQEEVARAVKPLQERLRSEREKREQAEAKLQEMAAG
mmetsp:Transcript_29825/g.48073  ORF Transcript_29825/g.48073 Transcript_29825/m.48073 type:complete len:196 (+) Transcript_29825:44-631(+)